MAISASSSQIQLCYDGFIDGPDAAQAPYRKHLLVDQQSCILEPLDNDERKTSPDYSSIQKSILSKSEAIILVYSITSRSSFESIPPRHQQIMQFINELPARSVLIYLVGNKSDKKSERKVSTKEGMAAAKKLGCAFAETSAKEGTNVELVFGDIVRSLRKLRVQNVKLVEEPKISWINSTVTSFFRPFRR